MAQRIASRAEVPSRVVDLVIFHMLHLHMPARRAEQAFARLKRDFVDWNEVRVSSLEEIQGTLGSCMSAASLAEAIRRLLGEVHRSQHETSLEFLNELTIAEVRKYLRSLDGVGPSTIDLVLRLKKATGVVPLDKSSERVLVRMGVVPSGYSAKQKQRFLRRLVPDDKVVVFHRSLMDLARQVCHERDDDVRCAACPMRRGCSYSRRMGQTGRPKAPRKARPSS